MKINYLGLAVPLFLFFMLLEFLIAKARKLPYFKLHNSIANISIGIAERLADVLVTGYFFFFYDYLQKHFGLFEIKAGVLLWILLFICTDFTWYWYHRLAHEINLFWAAHVVHHQSEDFNYTVSARITVFQAVIRTGFWSVLPLLGFPATMITSILLVHGLYPFFIHTRLIGKLGVLEYIFVTPSHHRVHHASNELYLDKNYGDVLIIWDKLFGTFQKEEDAIDIQYGLTHPLNSYSFLWQHFHFGIEILYTMRQTKGFRNKLKVLFDRPDTIPAHARETVEKFFLPGRKSRNRQDAPLSRYVVWQLAVTLTALFAFVLFEHQLTAYQQWLVTVCILLTLVNCGAVMEQKRWIVYLEISRLAVAGGALLITYPNIWVVLSWAILMLLCTLYFQTFKRYYFEWVYAR